MALEFDVVKAEQLSKENDERYIVVDKNTGEILDDVNGYELKRRERLVSLFDEVDEQ